jgi:uncharacterized delta-60 repeat protein
MKTFKEQNQQKFNFLNKLNQEGKNIMFNTKKSILTLSFITFMFNFISGYGQVTTAWTNRYNGPATSVDMASSVAVDGMGNTYVTGWSSGTSTGLDYCTIKYSPSGAPSPSWPDMGFGVGVRRFDGPVHGFDEAYKICVDGAGNAYVTGFITNTSATGIDWCTIKYSPTGVIMWIAIYDGGAGTGYDYPNDMCIDGMGNVYVAGSSTHDPSHIDYHDMTVIKYSPGGAPMWIKTYDGPAHVEDIAMSVKVDASGYVYVTGYADFGTVEHINFVTIKYDPSGMPSTSWSDVGLGFGVRKYNNPAFMNNDYAYALVVDPSGNVFVTGVTIGGVPLIEKDYATVKYTSSGVQEWVNIYHGPAFDDIPSAIALDPSGNVIVTGKSDEPGTPDFAYRTIKYSTAGAVMWVATYNGPGYHNPTNDSVYYDDEPTAMVVDGSGNIYVTGKSLGPTHYDYATVKYSSSGVQTWVMRYNGLYGLANDQASAIALDPTTGGVAVTGFSANSMGGPIAYDYLTIKYLSTPTGINGNENETPDGFSLMQNYPNPFNPSTVISYRLSVNSFVSLKVYDITGKLVKVLVDEQKDAGSYEVRFDGTNLSSGIYFYKLETGQFTDVKRMNLVK